MYEGDDLIVTDATCPNRLKVKTIVVQYKLQRINERLQSCHRQIVGGPFTRI